MNKLILLILVSVLAITGCAVNHLGEGLTAGRNSGYLEMRDHCYKASQQQNANPLAFKCLGEAYLNLGNRQLAEEAYLTYLAWVPSDVEARFAVINLYFSMGRYSASQVHIETVLNIQPGNLEGLHLLGESHRFTNNCAAALIAYDKALVINPGFQAAVISRTKAEQEICDLIKEKVRYISPPKKKVIIKKKIQAGGAALDESDW